MAKLCNCETVKTSKSGKMREQNGHKIFTFLPKKLCAPLALNYIKYYPTNNGIMDLSLKL